MLAGADTVPDEHSAIYSAVLANIQFSHTDNHQKVLIVRDTQCFI
jgi:hypothetical protein